jgi:hypothetical protein
MATEIRHGNLRFEAKVGGRFACTIVGYYTDDPELSASGVESVEWKSNRPTKRRAELLVLRAAFNDWMMQTLANLDRAITEGLETLP